jgi:hypothetical protein
LTASHLGSFKGNDDRESLDSKRQFSPFSRTDNSFGPAIVEAAKYGNVELAESLFLRMLKVYKENNKREEPSPKLLSFVLNAWTKQPRSKMKAAPEQAEALLMKVENDLQVFGAFGI